MSDLTLDLNQTIVSAVNARIEAEMVKALSGDETIATFVTAALRQTVETRDRSSYNTIKEPFITKVLRDAIQKATGEAVRRLIAEELPTIEDEVRKALKRDVRRIAETLTESLASVAEKPYGVDVKLDLKIPRDA